jgi:hypothetical protein
LHAGDSLTAKFVDQPPLVGEHNFEGIFDKRDDDGDVRAAAWRSMMSVACGDRHAVCYVPGGLKPEYAVVLALPAGSWKWSWVDPRTGDRAAGGVADAGRIALPPRPSPLDWVVLAERMQ